MKELLQKMLESETGKSSLSGLMGMICVLLGMVVASVCSFLGNNTGVVGGIGIMAQGWIGLGIKKISDAKTAIEFNKSAVKSAQPEQAKAVDTSAKTISITEAL